MSKKTASSAIAAKERAVDEAAAAAGSFVESERIWAQARIDDRQLMRRTIRQLRLTEKDRLEGNDEEERLLAEWWCSEQRVRDMVDPASRFDSLEYGDGPPVFHPFNGPRQTQEDIRDVIREFRREATKAFASWDELQSVYVEKVCRSIVNEPLELWTADWGDKEWIAFLYMSGMRTLGNVQFAVHSNNWPHALRMLKSALDSLRSISAAEMRPTRLLAQREAERSSVFASTRKKGADASRKYSSEQIESWKASAADPKISHLVSKRARAAYIQRNEGLPESAIETIRRVI